VTTKRARSAARTAASVTERIVPAGLKRTWPDIRPDDRAAVLAVLDRGELTGIGGVEATSLEREWAERLGVRFAVLFNSGTAAIHAALYGVGVGPGDEVITTAFTFSGTFQPIFHQNAVAKFVDIQPQTYTMDTTRIEPLITDRTRAILPVHIHGLPCDMDEIMAIARRHGLAVVEDAAQAHLATYRGRLAGTIGEANAFSLQATKNLSGIEGGIVVTDDADVARRARMLRTYGEGIDDGGDMGGWYFRPYTVFSVGWNYRSNEISAAFARSQLRRLDEYTAIAQRNGERLSNLLASVPGVIPPHVPPDRTSVYHKYRVRLDPAALGLDADPIAFRDRAMALLREQGVDAVLWHTEPVTSFPIFRTGDPDRPESLFVDADGERHVRAEDYPEAIKLLDSSLVICDEKHPIFVQEAALMDLYAEAFQHVFTRPELFEDLAGTTTNS
jgi:dTDP-4-amino-4,6-dideoxygalactose transaminase